MLDDCLGYYINYFSGFVLSFRYRSASILAGFENSLLERVYHERSPSSLCGGNADTGSAQDETERKRDARDKNYSTRGRAACFQGKSGVIG